MALPPVATLAERVRYVLDAFFGGHQPTMAEALGVHQPSVSRWATGKAKPSRRTLARLEKVAGVPVDWVLEGTGPIPRAEHAAGGAVASAEECLLPVFEELVEQADVGPDGRSATMRRRCLAPLYRPTRCYVRVWRDMPALWLRRSDYLLMETDPGWFRALHRYDGRLVGLRFKDTLALATVRAAEPGRGTGSPLEARLCGSSIPYEFTLDEGLEGGVITDVDPRRLVAVCLRLERDEVGWPEPRTSVSGRAKG